jgi:hypothetical protein
VAGDGAQEFALKLGFGKRGRTLLQIRRYEFGRDAIEPAQRLREGAFRRLAV